MKYLTIDEDEYQELIEAQNKLHALESFGVDNWEWYDDAMESLNEEDE